MKKQTTVVKTEMENPMRKIKMERVILSCSGQDAELDKSKLLLEYLTKRKAHVIKASSKTRIPDFNVKPNMEVGTRVTLRGQEAFDILKRLLVANDNQLSKKKIAENFFAFGIKEYIEIPGAEYRRDIGIRGLNATVVFVRAGVRVQRKKIKVGKLPARQRISREEIIKFMEDNFNIEII